MSTNTIYTQISKATVISKAGKTTEEIQNEISRFFLHDSKSEKPISLD